MSCSAREGLRGIDSLSRETTLSKLFLHSSEKGSALKQTKSFLIGKTLFKKALIGRKAKGSQKVVISLVKMAENLPSVSSPLKSPLFLQTVPITDSDQTLQMDMLIWVSAECKCWFMMQLKRAQLATHFERRERSELYGREYNQGRVTYNDVYFQQKLLWPIFSSFFFPEVVTGRWQDWGGLDYTASHKIWVSLISVTKWQETSVNKCHEHILLIIFIIYNWFTYIFKYWYSFFNDAVKDFWRDYRQVCAVLAFRLSLFSYYICFGENNKINLKTLLIWSTGPGCWKYF